MKKDLIREEDLRRKEKLAAFDRLLTVMDELRLNCPWDQKQTNESLRSLTIEETFELADALLEDNPEEIKKELGDILLHIVFYARIGQEQGRFDVADLIHALCDKLIFRHPHIYGDVDVEDEEAVKRNWEALKLQEKKGDAKKSVLEGVPKSLPAMVKAFRIQQKARGAGFDWEQPHQVWDKVLEELEEFKVEAENDSPKEKLEGEFGDILFALINYARFKGIDPETALARTNAKFIRRFQFMERGIEAQGKTLAAASLNEMEALWQEAKKGE